MYQQGNQEIWKGRTDAQYGEEGKLWHHAVKAINLTTEMPERTIVLLGFCTDEGVRRNLGRPGAVDGPDTIRQSLCSLAFHHQSTILDAGNCVVSNGNLESVQAQCTGFISTVLNKKSFTILLGGGHEISYSHFKGLAEFSGGRKIGIVNFDPHFDVRTYERGGHSGSWARQILDACPNVSYLPVGINPQVNVKALFSYMKEKAHNFLTMDELIFETEKCARTIRDFASRVDWIGVTLDMDVFTGGIAPGVSAPAAYGAFPQHIKPLLRVVAATGKWVSFDVAEMNPSFDDGRTAKLAALMVDEVVRLSSSVSI